MLRANPVGQILIEELIVVCTHRQNDQFLKYTKAYINPEITRVLYVNGNTEALNYRNFSHNKKAAFNELLSQFRQQLAANPARLITFVLDFNLGYSGLNISPVQELIATLESEYERSYFANLYHSAEEQELVNNFAFVNSSETLSIAKNDGKIPFRFILTGGGGEDVALNYDGFKNLNPTEAFDSYNYCRWPFNKFLGAMRSKQSADDSPLPVQTTPLHRTRTLGAAKPSSRAPSAYTYSISSSSSSITSVPTASPTYSPSSTLSTLSQLSQESLGEQNFLQRCGSTSSTNTTLSASPPSLAGPDSPIPSPPQPVRIFSDGLSTSSISSLLSGNLSIVLRASSENNIINTPHHAPFDTALLNISTLKIAEPATPTTSVDNTEHHSPPREVKRPSPIKTPERGGADVPVLRR